MELTPAQIETYAARALGGKRSSSGHRFRTACPIHSGKNPNFAFDLRTGLWYCHSKCAQGGGIIKLEMLIANCGWEQAVETVARATGCPLGALLLRKGIQASYSYFDASGRLLFEKYRLIKDDHKTFQFRQPAPGGGWEWKGTRPKVLYNLPSVVTAQSVLIVEGEKAADRLNRTQWQASGKLYMVATCTPNGAGSWQDAYSAYLAGKNVVVLVDNDESGRRHRDEVLASVSKYPVASIRSIDFEDLPEKADVYDYLETHKPEELLQRIRTAKDLLKSDLLLPKKPAIAVEFSEFAANYEDHTSWIIPGVIHSGANGLIVANPKVGKSLAVLDLLLSLASGEPWLGIDIERRVKTMYVSREDHPETTIPRYKRLLAGKGCTSDVNGWMYYSSVAQCPEFYLDQEAHLDAMIETLRDFHIEFAVFDVFRRLHLGDENDNSQIAKVLSGLTRIEHESGCQVALIHHLNKNTDGPLFNRIRGASAIHGWAEWSIGINSEAGDDDDEQVRKTEFETKAGKPHRPVYWKPIDGDGSLRLEPCGCPVGPRKVPPLIPYKPPKEKAQ